MKHINRIILLVFLVTFFSCHENIPQVKSPQNYVINNYSDVFEAFWTGMNANYVFWDIDRTNWDSVHTVYQPLFASLTAFNTTNDAQARQYFTNMTAKLIDSHYLLTFASGQQISPAENRKVAIHQVNPDSIYSLPTTFFAQVVNKNYLDPSTLLTGTDTVLSEGSKTPFTATTARLSSDKTILYLRLSAFFITQAVKAKPALDYFFANIVSAYPTLKGVIIDVRENGGGETTDINLLTGSFTSSTYTYGYTHSKSSIGRLDFTPWLPAVIYPVSPGVNFQKPIAVLADHFSVSAAELTALAIRSIPGGYGKIIGTTTFGANGPLAPNEFLNDGQFTVGGTNFGPKGYVFVYTSSTMFKASDGSIYEGRGIPADRWIVETSAAYSAGKDLQLEEAINYINGK